ncbi:MAG: hypothetical protein FJ077_03330 [Cyanobacteria bacterium K_DeepCast_35m_m2_023]|nr:hypothetical protein [Cyanobacteria bacterium K_DeepCast_35m_m2_023]
MAAGQRIRHPAARATAAVLGLLLTGCSGTPLGDQLARSFSAPSPQPSPAARGSGAAATPPKPADTVKAASDASSGTTSTTAKPAGTPTTTGTPIAPTTTPRPVPAAPAPYRITIKLPAADPSAPAELVTEALRRAGVPFEVEMIERVSAPTPAAPGLPAPAPAPRPR